MESGCLKKELGLLNLFSCTLVQKVGVLKCVLWPNIFCIFGFGSEGRTDHSIESNTGKTHSGWCATTAAKQSGKISELGNIPSQVTTIKNKLNMLNSKGLK